MKLFNTVWHKFGYRVYSSRYRKLWGKPGDFQYRAGIDPKKILVCMPPLDGPIQEAVRAIAWLPSLFPDAEIRIVHYDEVAGSIPIQFRSWGVLEKKHFNPFGLPKRSFLEEIRSWEADLAIDLSDPANEVTDLICATCGCKWHASLASGSRTIDPNANIVIIPREGSSRTERYAVLLRYLAQAG